MTDHPKLRLDLGAGLAVDLEVHSEAECEQCSMVVCAPTGYFPDDVHTVCAQCGTAIVHRPYAPKAPPKVCLRCATALLEQQKGHA